MPLLEDYQNLLEQEERRKTLFGNALSSLDNINPPEQDEIEDNYDHYEENWGDEDIEPTDEELLDLEQHSL